MFARTVAIRLRSSYFTGFNPTSESSSARTSSTVGARTSVLRSPSPRSASASVLSASASRFPDSASRFAWRPVASSKSWRTKRAFPKVRSRFAVSFAIAASSPSSRSAARTNSFFFAIERKIAASSFAV